MSESRGQSSCHPAILSHYTRMLSQFFFIAKDQDQSPMECCYAHSKVHGNFNCQRIHLKEYFLTQRFFQKEMMIPDPMYFSTKYATWPHDQSQRLLCS